MKDKNKYVVDSFNRLIIRRKGKNLLVDGRFFIDKNNQLGYLLNKKQAWLRQYNLARKITFKGNWKLSPDYDLEMVLDKTKDQYQNNRLNLKGKIISTEADSLVFAINSINKEGLLYAQILKLSGFWQADRFNRINFLIEKKGSPDTLIFQGSWEVNKNQQIVYKYEKTILKSKNKESHLLTFEGFWQITNANKLTYIMSTVRNSQFDFRVQLESLNLYPQQGRIKYRLGIGLKKTKAYRNKIISLYGIWKFNRKLGLIYQMHYDHNEIRVIDFGAEVNFNKKEKLQFFLSNQKKQPLGLRLNFTHRFLKKLDAEAYLKLEKIKKESKVSSGIRIPF